MEQANTETDPARRAPPLRPYCRTGRELLRIRARPGAKLTQHAMGRLLGYSDTSANATVSKLENGSACPTAHALARLYQLDSEGTGRLLAALASDLNDLAAGMGA